MKTPDTNKHDKRLLLVAAHETAKAVQKTKSFQREEVFLHRRNKTAF